MTCRARSLRCRSTLECAIGQPHARILSGCPKRTSGRDGQDHLTTTLRQGAAYPADCERMYLRVTAGLLAQRYFDVESSEEYVFRILLIQAFHILPRFTGIPSQCLALQTLGVADDAARNGCFMRCRPTWRAARRWPSRMHWSWLRLFRARAPHRKSSPTSSAGDRRVWAGCTNRPVAETICAVYRQLRLGGRPLEQDPMSG